MALEDQLLEVYNKKIDENESYDRSKFADKFYLFSKLERYLSNHKQNPNDPDNFSDFGKLLHKNPLFYNEFSNPASVISIEGDAAYTAWADAMGKYVKNNLDDFFDLLDDKSWINLISTIPLYKTKEKDAKDEYHDKFVEAAGELKKIREASSSNDFSKISDYVNSKLDEAPEWLQTSISYLRGNKEYMSAMFQEFAGIAQTKFQEELFIYTVDKDGRKKPVKVNKGRLKTIVKDSLKKAWELHDEETDKGDQNDIWQGDLRNCYLMLARSVYPKEKKTEDWDDDEDKQERQGERQVAGLNN